MTLTERFPQLRSRGVRHALALLLVGGSSVWFFVAAHVLASPYLVSFMVAVVLSSLLGIGPGCVAWLAATLASDFFFTPPIFDLNFDRFTSLAAANYALALLFGRACAQLVRHRIGQSLLFEKFVLGLNGKPFVGRIDGALEGELYGWAVDTNVPSLPPTCISTGARISEVLGLQLKYLDLSKGAISIRQRHCRGDVDEPKTKNSKGTLTLGCLSDRYREWITKKAIAKPTDWLFPQPEDATKPMWDSCVPKVLKGAAKLAGCDFEGFGLHSFRRANITWRQEVGGSAIEASKIAGHATVSMTNDYTHVQLKRQDEVTRAIQQRLRKAAKEPHAA